MYWRFGSICCQYLDGFLLQNPLTRNAARSTWYQTQLSDGISAKYKHQNDVKTSLILRNCKENFVRICLFWWVAQALAISTTFSRFTTGDDYKWQSFLLCDFLQPRVIQIHTFFSATNFLSSSFNIRTTSLQNKVRGETIIEISGFHRSPYRCVI
jgi:hypothetical protein